GAVPGQSVKVERVASSLCGLGDLLVHTGEVGRENRRGEFHGHRALKCWTPRRCSESMHPAGRCTPHRTAGPTAPPPALARSSPRRRDSSASACCLLPVYSRPTAPPPSRPWDV